MVFIDVGEDGLGCDSEILVGYTHAIAGAAAQALATEGMGSALLEIRATGRSLSLSGHLLLLHSID